MLGTVKNVKTGSKSGQNSQDFAKSGQNPHGMKLLTNNSKSQWVFGFNGMHHESYFTMFSSKIAFSLSSEKSSTWLLLFLQRRFTQNQGQG